MVFSSNRSVSNRSHQQMTSTLLVLYLLLNYSSKKTRIPSLTHLCHHSSFLQAQKYSTVLYMPPYSTARVISLAKLRCLFYFPFNSLQALQIAASLGILDYVLSQSEARYNQQNICLKHIDENSSLFL